MRFFILLFLLGTALAKPVQDALEFEADEILAHLELNPALKEHLALADDDDDLKTKVVGKLKEHLRDLLERVVKALENGDSVHEAVLNKIKEIREKLKDLKAEIGEKAKKVIEKIKHHVRDFWAKLLENLKHKDETVAKRAEEGGDTEHLKNLKESLNDLLGKIKDAIDHGKTVKEDILEKVKGIREEIKKVGGHLAKHTLELLEQIKEKAKEWWQKLLEKIGGTKEESVEKRAEEEENVSTAFDKILEKIRDAIEKGKEIKEDTLQRLKELKEKLKAKGQKMSEKAKELIKEMKEKAHEFLKKILEKLGWENEPQQAFPDFGLREKIEKLREQLDIKPFDSSKIIELCEKIFGRFSEVMHQIKKQIEGFGESAVDFIRDKLNKFFPPKDERSVGALWEKLKEYFEDLKITLQEKYFKFAEWVKESLSKVLDKGKSKLENLKKIAEELRDHALELSKDVLEEGKEFLRQYKDELGSLWEQTKKAIEEALKKKEE